MRRKISLLTTHCFSSARSQHLDKTTVCLSGSGTNVDVSFGLRHQSRNEKMNNKIYGFLADFIAVAHIAYAGTIVLGLVLILIGYFTRWQWVRNPWLRGIHLAMILIVVAEAWAGVTCPLTIWEDQLRTLAGQSFDGESGIAQAIHFLLFFDAPWWVFTACYTICGTMIVLSLVLVPPHWRKPQEPVSQDW